MDPFGNLYGTTLYGGSHTSAAYCESSGSTGCGAVFKLTTDGKESLLYSFNAPDGPATENSGYFPVAGLALDSEGDLYGTTELGGNLQDCSGDGYVGCGVVFKLSGTKETVMYSFTGRRDGAFPLGGVVLDANRAFYGTASSGGDQTCQCGVVFKLSDRELTILHSFEGAPDGAEPVAGVTIDSNGNLYGTTQNGGDIDCDYPYEDCGVVFKLAGKKETILHAFKGTPDGDHPQASPFIDTTGNLYGTTVWGGEGYSVGTVFEMKRDGKEDILHRFRVNYQRQHDGIYPYSSLVRDAQGNLYGTTQEGGDCGTAAGTVFEITTDGKEKILHSFCGTDDGAYPSGNLITDEKGNLYGTAPNGGLYGNGVVFMITP